MRAGRDMVRWPTRYAPGTAPVHVRNELEMNAPPDLVWAWLIRAQLWPSWYVNSSDVKFLEGTPPDLTANRPGLPVTEV